MRCNVFAVGDRTDRSVEHFIRKLHPDCDKFIIERNGAYFNITAVPPSPTVEVKPTPKVEPKAPLPKEVKKETVNVKKQVRPSTRKRSTKRSR